MQNDDFDEVDFGNDESFLFFIWICARQPGPEALIAEAFKNVKRPRAGNLPRDNMCFIVRDRLADQLHNVLVRAAATPDPLLHRKLSPDGLAKVNCQAVAQALLVRAGKWSPPKLAPAICPRCGGTRTVRILWEFHVPWRDINAVQSGHSILASNEPPENPPAWCCLTCEPTWETIHRLAIEREVLFEKAVSAIAEKNFDEAPTA